MSYYHINNNDNKMKLYYKTEEDKQNYLVNKYYNVDDLNEYLQICMIVMVYYVK